MTAAASWMLALLWFSILVFAEAAIILALWRLYRRFGGIAAYARSFFDDPVNGNKASIARACAALAMLGAIAITAALILFAFRKPESVGMAGVLTGALTTLLGTGVLGLLLRKKADGSSETIDDVREVREVRETPAIIARAEVVAPPVPPAVPEAPPS